MDRLTNWEFKRSKSKKYFACNMNERKQYEWVFLRYGIMVSDSLCNIRPPDNENLIFAIPRRQSAGAIPDISVSVSIPLSASSYGCSWRKSCQPLPSSNPFTLLVLTQFLVFDAIEYRHLSYLMLSQSISLIWTSTCSPQWGWSRSTARCQHD